MDWRTALLSTLCFIGLSELTPLKDGDDFSTCFEMDDDGESCHRKTTTCQSICQNFGYEGHSCKLDPSCQEAEPGGSLNARCLCSSKVAARTTGKYYNAEEEGKISEFIDRAEKELEQNAIKSTFIEWAFATNITEETEKTKLDYQSISDALKLKLGKEAKQFHASKLHKRDLSRKLKMISNIGASALPREKLEEYNKITTNMAKIYSTAKVPAYEDKSKKLSLDPGVTEALAKSTDPKELEYYWTEWRKVTGREMRDLYARYVELTNEAARANGFTDGTDWKTNEYESDTFVQEMEETWQGLKPLYQQLHAYVRNKLVKRYGEETVEPDGPIPAHLLGNMWAQSWSNIATMLTPYPDKPTLDVTEAMVKQGWTPKIMFEKADEFFQSMGLPEMPEAFWKDSLLERPKDGRELVCHASAEDFYNGVDYRIKQCTKVNMEDFITVNHEMGHVQYHLAYKNQSFLFRSGANPGFHEGVADILSIAVGTAGYFQRLGLLSNDVDATEKETEINMLFNMAMEKLVFLPFGYLVDKYRWDLFSGVADEKSMNCHWAKLRMDIQGVAPPNMRTEEDFDAGSKYHVAADAGYVRYFTAHIYEFQFYKALCEVSGQYVPGDPNKPLHRCNFYGSEEAGKKLLSMLELGESKPWKEVMEVMTGEPKMDTAAFREYFKPLEEWLKEENERTGVTIGWKSKDLTEVCTP